MWPNITSALVKLMYMTPYIKIMWLHHTAKPRFLNECLQQYKCMIKVKVKLSLCLT